FSAKFNHDGTRIIVGSSLDGVGEVRIYQGATKPDPEMVALSAVMAGPTRGFSGILLAPSLKNSGHQVCKLEGQQGAVYSVAYRPDGKQVASAGFDGKVRLNDPDTGKLLKEFIPVPLTVKK